MNLLYIGCMKGVSMNTCLVLNFGGKKFIRWCVLGEVKVDNVWMNAKVV
jgi:hypothetical protein